MNLMDALFTRRRTLAVKCKDFVIGGDAEISVQTMTKTDTRDIAATRKQVSLLSDRGADIIRLAVPDQDAVKAFGQIRKDSPCPLVADIHFDYRLAIDSLDAGADKVRINPGNIGGYEKVLLVAKAAAKNGAGIRVGINGGSLEREILDKHGGPVPEALVESATRCVDYLRDRDFHNIVISLKSSSVKDTVKAYVLMADKTDLPFHIGVTEAGPGQSAIIKSTAGVSTLLALGIGDTVRVSLTGDALDEVDVAKDILQSLSLRSFGPNVISCPTCGRTQVDLIPIANEVKRRLRGTSSKVTVAVMGCPVNGPGEAREADFGIACGRDGGILFSHGKVLRRVAPEEMVDALLRLVEEENGHRRE